MLRCGARPRATVAVAAVVAVDAASGAAAVAATAAGPRAALLRRPIVVLDRAAADRSDAVAAAGDADLLVPAVPINCSGNVAGSRCVAFDTSAAMSPLLLWFGLASCWNAIGKC